MARNDVCGVYVMCIRIWHIDRLERAMTPKPQFAGPDVTPQDEKRLNSQLARVRILMMDANWRTLQWIAQRVGGSEASVSARLRQLRDPRFGGYTVERERVEGKNGLFIYRVLPPTRSGQMRLL